MTSHSENLDTRPRAVIIATDGRVDSVDLTGYVHLGTSPRFDYALADYRENF